VVAALAGALLVDTLPELQAAWRAMIRRGVSDTDRAELGRMPITESKALELSAGPGKTPWSATRKRSNGRPGRSGNTDAWAMGDRPSKTGYELGW